MYEYPRSSDSSMFAKKYPKNEDKGAGGISQPQTTFIYDRSLAQVIHMREKSRDCTLSVHGGARGVHKSRSTYNSFDVFGRLDEDSDDHTLVEPDRPLEPEEPDEVKYSNGESKIEIPSYKNRYTTDWRQIKPEPRVEEHDHVDHSIFKSFKKSHKSTVSVPDGKFISNLIDFTFDKWDKKDVSETVITDTEESQISEDVSSDGSIENFVDLVTDSLLVGKNKESPFSSLTKKKFKRRLCKKILNSAKNVLSVVSDCEDSYETDPMEKIAELKVSPLLHEDKQIFRYNAIVSYGVILLTLDKEKTPNYFIYKPRDTHEYLEFLRDRMKNEHIAEKYIQLMRKSEKKRIIDYYKDKNIRPLLEDICLESRRIDGREMKKMEAACLKNIKKYERLLEDPLIGIEDGDMKWGFPKGRKDNMAESDMICAIREMEEEIVISKDLVKPMKIKPFEEYYTGSNNKFYKNVFFVAYIENKHIPDVKYKFTKLRSYVSEEAEDLKVVPLIDACCYLDQSKIGMIMNISRILRKEKHIVKDLLAE